MTDQVTNQSNHEILEWLSTLNASEVCRLRSAVSISEDRKSSEQSSTNLQNVTNSPIDVCSSNDESSVPEYDVIIKPVKSKKENKYLYVIASDEAEKDDLIRKLATDNQLDNFEVEHININISTDSKVKLNIKHKQDESSSCSVLGEMLNKESSNVIEISSDEISTDAIEISDDEKESYHYMEVDSIEVAKSRKRKRNDLNEPKKTPEVKWRGTLLMDNRRRLVQSVPCIFPYQIRKRNARSRVIESFTQVKLISIAWKTGVTNPADWNKDLSEERGLPYCDGYARYVDGWRYYSKKELIDRLWKHLLDTDQVHIV